MAGTAGEQVRAAVDAVYRADSRRILATLIRLLGDFDLAEDALHGAFRTALKHWPNEGVLSNPRAWLVSTGRFKAIDTIGRRARFDASKEAVAESRTFADRSAARARSDRPACAHAVAGVPALCADFPGWRPGAARRPGPLVLELGSDRGREGFGGTGAGIAQIRRLHHSSRDFDRACGNARCHLDRLGTDRGTVRRTGPSRAVARRRIESGRGGRHARRTTRGTDPGRRHPRARRSGRLPPGARGAGGPLQATWTDERGENFLRARSCPHPAGTGAAVSPATAEGFGVICHLPVDSRHSETTIGTRL